MHIISKYGYNCGMIVAATSTLLLITGCALQSPRAKAQAPSLLGSGRGLDHIVIVVHNLDEAVRTYQDVLGFVKGPGGSFVGGISNAGIMFASNYVELVGVDLSQASGDTNWAEQVAFLQKREGPQLLGLRVSSAKDTADFLRNRGVDAAIPEEVAYKEDGMKKAETGNWEHVMFNKPVLPANPIFFVQYKTHTPRSLPEHPNTAKRLSSVWMAVKDVKAAANAYESVGFRLGKSVRSPLLGAKGREVLAGQGSILLLQAENPKGSLASFLARYGEGIVGMSVEVADLKTARALIQSATKTEFAPYRTPGGESILVPPKLAHGAWIELSEKYPH